MENRADAVKYASARTPENINRLKPKKSLQLINIINVESSM